MEEALAMLDDVEQDAFKVFGFVDRGEDQIIMEEILQMLAQEKMPYSELMMKMMMLKHEPKRTRGIIEAMIEARMIEKIGADSNPTIRLVETAAKK